MVLRAMYSGVSGLRAEGEALGVVGDNIANTNTVGFKSQRAIFQDVLGHSILAGTSASLPGSGVRVGKIQQMFNQGTLANTGVATDLALNGDGFFVVNGTVDGISSNFYTRAGQFVLDKDGFLTNAGGLKVQGYAANGDGTFQPIRKFSAGPSSCFDLAVGDFDGDGWIDALVSNYVNIMSESGWSMTTIKNYSVMFNDKNW